MKNPLKATLIAVFILYAAGCRKETARPVEEKKIEQEQTEKKEASAETDIAKITVGGLYAFPNKDKRSYVIMKVLAVEKKIVHVKRYINRFANIPTYLDTSALTLGDVGTPGNTGVPHMALGIEWFWPTNPVLLTTEQVTDEERQLIKEFKEKRKKTSS